MSNIKIYKEKEIKPNGTFSGRRFLFKDRLNGEIRCPICGRWFHWVDFPKPHCGNSSCEYFWVRRFRHLNRAAKQDTKERERFFESPETVKKLLNKCDDFVKRGLL